MYSVKNNKGNALALVLTIVIVASVAIAVAIKETNKRNYQVKDAELLENVRDGVKAAKQYMTTEVIREWQQQYAAGNTENGIPTEANFVGALDTKIATFLGNRFETRDGWQVVFQPRSTATPVSNSDALDGTYYTSKPSDPFRFNIGVLDSWLQDGFNVHIGRLSNPTDVTSKLAWGARINSGGTRVDGKILYPTNFAWLDVSDNPNFATSNVSVNLAKYLDAQTALTDPAEVAARRTGGIFFRGQVSANGLKGVSYNGEKPIFIQGGVTGVGESPKLPTSNGTSQTSAGASLEDRYLLGTTSVRSPVPDQAIVTLGNDNGAVFLTNRQVPIYSATDITKNGGKLTMFTNASGSRVPEVNPSEFWNSSPVKAQASLKLNLYWNGTRPTLVVPTPNPSGSYTLPLTADANLREVNRAAVWNYYGKSNWVKFFARHGVTVNCAETTQACFNQTWDNEGAVIALNDLPVKESYLNGGVRIQTFPEHHEALGESSYLAVEPIRLSGHNGVYVTVSEDSSSYNLLANSALLLVGTRIVEPLSGTSGSPITITDGINYTTSDYGVILPGDRKMYFGTNGRLTLDTRINIDGGTAVTVSGSPTSTISALTYLKDPNNNLSATPASIGKKSIFASKQRVAVTSLGGGAGTGYSEAEQLAYAKNFGITGEQLITGNGAGFIGLYKPTGVVKTEEITNELMSTATVGKFRAINSVANDGVKPTGFDAELLAAGITETVGIKDLKNLDYTTDDDVAVNARLREWARLKIIQVLGQPTTTANTPSALYNQAILYRLSDSGVPSNLRDAMLDALLINLGRKEETAYVRVYAQRYGWTGTTTEVLKAKSDLNLRVGFSGNLKSTLIANCLNADGSAKEEVLKTEPLTLANGQVVNYSNIPATRAFTISANGEVANTGYVFPYNNVSFFTPGSPAPKNLTQLLTAYREGASADLQSYFNAEAQTEAVLNDHKTVPAYTISAGTAYTSLVTRLNNAVAQVNNNFVTQSITNGTDPWTIIAGATPLFGRMEYTVAVSVDTGTTDSIIQAGPKFNASWTTDLSDPSNPGATVPLRLYSVKFERYNPVNIAGIKEVSQESSNVKAQVPAVYDALLQAVLTNGLDVSATGKLQTAIDVLLLNGQATPLTVTKVKDFMDTVNALALDRVGGTAVRTQTLATMPGGITGKRLIEYNIDSPAVTFRGNSTTAANWNFYFASNSGGHQSVGSTNYGLGTYEDLLVAQIAQNIVTTLDKSASVFVPTRNVSAAAGVGLVPVMTAPVITAARTHTFAAYEPKWNNPLIAQITSGSYIDTTQVNTNNVALSNAVREAVYKRDVKFKLFAKLNGTYNDPSEGRLDSFTGIGVLMTGASSPQPILLSTANADDKYFTWVGTVITGINSGTYIIPDDTAQRQLPAQLIGDPELVGPPPSTPALFGQASGLLAESRKGLWGTIMLIEDKSNDGDAEHEVRAVPTLEIR